jgi:hypothetical protein
VLFEIRQLLLESLSCTRLSWDEMKASSLTNQNPDNQEENRGQIPKDTAAIHPFFSNQ